STYVLCIIALHPSGRAVTGLDASCCYRGRLPSTGRAVVGLGVGGRRHSQVSLTDGADGGGSGGAGQRVIRGRRPRNRQTGHVDSLAGAHISVVVSSTWWIVEVDGVPAQDARQGIITRHERGNRCAVVGLASSAGQTSGKGFAGDDLGDRGGGAVAKV